MLLYIYLKLKGKNYQLIMFKVKTYNIFSRKLVRKNRLKHLFYLREQYHLNIIYKKFIHSSLILFQELISNFSNLSPIQSIESHYYFYIHLIDYI